MKHLVFSSLLLSSLCLYNTTQAQPTFTKVGDIINSRVNISYKLNNSGFAFEGELYGKEINFIYFDTSGYKVEISGFKPKTLYYADTTFLNFIKIDGYEKKATLVIEKYNIKEPTTPEIITSKETIEAAFSRSVKDEFRKRGYKLKNVVKNKQNDLILNIEVYDANAIDHVGYYYIDVLYSLTDLTFKPIVPKSYPKVSDITFESSFWAASGSKSWMNIGLVENNFIYSRDISYYNKEKKQIDSSVIGFAFYNFDGDITKELYLSTLIPNRNLAKINTSNAVIAGPQIGAAYHYIDKANKIIYTYSFAEGRKKSNYLLIIKKYDMNGNLIWQNTSIETEFDIDHASHLLKPLYNGNIAFILDKSKTNRSSNRTIYELDKLSGNIIDSEGPTKERFQKEKFNSTNPIVDMNYSLCNLNYQDGMPNDKTFQKEFKEIKHEYVEGPDAIFKMSAQHYLVVLKNSKSKYSVYQYK